MFRKALLQFWFASLAMSAAHSCSAKANPETGFRVMIAVYNDAEVPAEILTLAEAAGTAIFRQTGVHLEWLRCGAVGEGEAQSKLCGQAAFPAHLQLHILSASTKLSTLIFGISYLADDGTGCYSDVFYSRVIQLARQLHVGAGSILGRVMAHEIGHLLLGRNSHSATGIMRELWQPEDLARLSKGMLLFSPEQSQAMRRKLAGSSTR